LKQYGSVKKRQTAYGPLVEPFRVDASFPSCLKFSEASTSLVIPEIFYRESKFFLLLLIFKSRGPRLKDCWGDGRGVIGPFRNERQGAIEPFRGDPPSRHSRNFLSGIQIFSSSLVFQYCGPRLEDCRGDEEVGIHVFAPSFRLSIGNHRGVPSHYLDPS